MQEGKSKKKIIITVVVLLLIILGIVQFSGMYNFMSLVRNVDESGLSIPNLDRKVTFSNATTLDDGVKKIVKEKINSIQAELKDDSKNTVKWIELGLYQKMAGDYIGASLSWEYVSKVATTDYISLGNLGDLYAYYIKDKIKSENYFKRAITNGPTQTYLYAQLSSVYKDVFGDLVKARSIIDQGLSKNPNNPNLLETKENLK